MKKVKQIMTMAKSMIQNSKIRNALLLLYILAVLGFSAAARAEMESFPVMKINPAGAELKTVVGEIAITVDGKAFLVVSDDVVYELRDGRQDLAALNGALVQVRGYELMHKYGPVYQVSWSNPLLDQEPTDQLAAPVLVVLQLSELR